jgi:hypothetical protein
MSSPDKNSEKPDKPVRSGAGKPTGEGPADSSAGGTADESVHDRDSQRPASSPGSESFDGGNATTKPISLPDKSDEDTHRSIDLEDTSLHSPELTRVMDSTAASSPVEPGQAGEVPIDRTRIELESLATGGQVDKSSRPNNPAVELEATSHDQLVPTRVDSDLKRLDAAKVTTRTRAPLPELTEHEKLEEVPYSLQPRYNQHLMPGTQSRFAELTSRIRIKPRGGIILGTLLGLCCGSWLYFHTWPVEFVMKMPVRGEVKTPEVSRRHAPPRNWSLFENMCLGKDLYNRPWHYNMQTGVASRSGLSAPPALDEQNLSLVGRPPLEKVTRLSWIETHARTSRSRLIVRDYPFLPEGSDVKHDPADLMDWQVPLDPVGYPFSPIVVDHPESEVGSMIVVHDDRGKMTAWKPQIQGGGRPLWTQTLVSVPLTRGESHVSWQDEDPSIMLILVTNDGLHVFNSENGEPLGSTGWSGELLETRVPRLSQLPFGRYRDAWVVCDGFNGYVFRVDLSGQPVVLKEFRLARDFGGDQQKPRLLTLPDLHVQDEDHLLVISPKGHLAWLEAGMPMPDESAADLEIELDQLVPPGELVAIDLNGDACWDIVGMSPGGELWVFDGKKRQIHDLLSPDPQEPGETGTATADVGSGILWNLTEEQLIEGFYFNPQGIPFRLKVPLAIPFNTHTGRIFLRFSGS